MTNPKRAGEDDAAYWAGLISAGVPPDKALAMVVARISSRILADTLKQKKEPWE